MYKYVARYRYQILLFVIILFAYFPVSFQILALKNDIIQLDFPVKYFISQQLHKGELPIWMYNWGAGFPLGHAFTWSVYNPVTLFLCLLFEYNISTLHLEFMFYIFLGAAGVWKICRNILGLSLFACLIAALTYTLSGITLSCSQFLAYIASIGFLPWVYYSYIMLIKNPNLYRSLCFSLFSFLLISWSYPAAFIICFYSIVGLLFIYLYYRKNKAFNKKFLSFLFLSIVVALILSLPLLYTTYYTLPYFSRSEQLVSDTNNFGYLDGTSFFSIFYPFINTNKVYDDSTFLFQNINIGTLGLGLIFGLFFQFKYLGQYRKVVFYLIISALFFLILAGGEQWYLKGLMDVILPGFNWFRFPSFFRLFFLLSACILVGIGVDHFKRNLKFKLPHKTIFLIIPVISIVIILYHLIKLVFFSNAEFKIFSLQMVLPFITLCWLVLLLFLVYFKNNDIRFIKKLLIADLLVIAIISLPVYTVGSYTLNELNDVLFKHDKQQLSNISINNNSGYLVDKKGNPFNNLNIYSNTISAEKQYVGPLYLKSLTDLQDSKYLSEPPASIIFSNNEDVKMINNSFQNHTFSAEVIKLKEGNIMLFQLWHPFWKAYINNKETPVFRSNEGINFIKAPIGTIMVSFVYKDRILDNLTRLFFISIILLIISILILKWKTNHV